MDTKLNESFERSCRLCAQEQEASIFIFGGETETINLPSLIKNYVKIEIKPNDPLPKNICLTCCNKLRLVAAFIENAWKSQEVLCNQRAIIDASLSKEPNGNSSDKLVIKEEPEQYFDDDSENVTELEVNVDPMLLLQNNESADDDEVSKIKKEQTFSLKIHDNADVTLTLIKSNSEDGESNKNNEDQTNDVQKPFPCKNCPRSFYSEIALKSHQWCHVNTVEFVSHKFQCLTCKFDFSTKRELIEHYKTHKHMGLHCTICARSFRSEENLQLHLESHRLNAHNYTCKFCGRTYKTLSNLKTHSVTHSTERPFKCTLCKKGFKRNQDLKFHLNQHTGAKPYKCPYCDRCFASSGNCYSHRNRMHPGRGGSIRQQYVSRNQLLPISNESQPVPKLKKFYRCNYCPRTFTRRENLIYHTYQHNGKKPYKCNECSRCFLSHRSMALHTYNDHNGKIFAADQLRKLKTEVNLEEAED